MQYDDRTLEFPAQPGPASDPLGQTRVQPAGRVPNPAAGRTQVHPVTPSARYGTLPDPAAYTHHSRSRGPALSQTLIRNPVQAMKQAGLSCGEGTFAFFWGLLVMLLVVAIPARFFTYPDGMYTPGYGPYEIAAFAFLIPLAVAGVALLNQMKD
jgi:hypothetical protein